MAGRITCATLGQPIAADNIISDFVAITHIHTSKLTLQRSHLPPATGRPFIQHAIRCNSMRFVVNFQFNCNIFECLWNCYASPHKYALVVCVVATYVACVAGNRPFSRNSSQVDNSCLLSSYLSVCLGHGYIVLLIINIIQLSLGCLLFRLLHIQSIICQLSHLRAWRLAILPASSLFAWFCLCVRVLLLLRQFCLHSLQLAVVIVMLTSCYAK